MTLLDDIERSERKKVAFHAHVNRTSSPYRAMCISFLVAPFMLLEFVFVPFFGQVIVLLGILLSLRYLWLKRSFLLILMGFGGAAGSLSLFALYAKQFQASGAPVFYFLVTFATFISISYLIFMAGALWLHYHHREFRHQGGSELPDSPHGSTS